MFRAGLLFCAYTSTLLVAGATWATPTIELQGETITLGQAVEFTVTGLPGNKRDRVAISRVDQPKDKSVSRKNTRGVTEGVWSFKIRKPGDYEVRVYLYQPEGNFDLAARKPFSVLSITEAVNAGLLPKPEIKINNTTLIIGQPIEIAATNLPKTSQSSLAISRIEQDSSKVVKHKSLRNRSEGAWTHILKKPGEYEAQVYLDRRNSGFGPVASQSFRIVSTTEAIQEGLLGKPRIQMSATKILVEKPLEVTITNLPGNSRDQITIVKLDKGTERRVAKESSVGLTGGSWTFNIYDTGDYEVRVYTGLGRVIEDPVAKQQFQVVTASEAIETGVVSKPRIKLQKNVYVAGESIHISVTGLPGGSSDKITLHNLKFASPVNLIRTKGETEGSWTFKTEITGEYEIRVHTADRTGEQLLARSPVKIISNTQAVSEGLIGKPKVILEDGPFEAGKTFSVNVTDLPGSQGEFLAISHAWQDHHQYYVRTLTRGATGGSFPFYVSDPGEYEVRLYLHSGYPVARKRIEVFDSTYAKPYPECLQQSVASAAQSTDSELKKNVDAFMGDWGAYSPRWDKSFEFIGPLKVHHPSNLKMYRVDGKFVLMTRRVGDFQCGSKWLIRQNASDHLFLERLYFRNKPNIACARGSASRLMLTENGKLKEQLGGQICDLAGPQIHASGGEVDWSSLAEFQSLKDRDEQQLEEFNALGELEYRKGNQKEALAYFQKSYGSRRHKTRQVAEYWLSQINLDLLEHAKKVFCEQNDCERMIREHQRFQEQQRRLQEQTDMWRDFGY